MGEVESSTHKLISNSHGSHLHAWSESQYITNRLGYTDRIAKKLVNLASRIVPREIGFSLVEGKTGNALS